MSSHQQVIVVTGATSGIGLASVRSLVQSGASVIGVGRSTERNQQAQDAVTSAFPDARVAYLLADLADQAQVRALAEAIHRLLTQWGFSHLDALVNNAGLYLEKKQMTVDGIEKTFAVNHLAPFLLTQLLLPLLRRAEKGRVLTVSSYSHWTTPLCLSRVTDPWPYIGLLAYKRSKLSNVLFTYEFNRREPDVRAFAVDPGLVNTGIASKGSRGISHWVWRSRRKAGTSPDVPAETIQYLIEADELDPEAGFYYRDKAALTPSRKARNEALAAKLWAISCRLTGLQPS